MSKPFEIIESVGKEEVINLFTSHEVDRPNGRDNFAYERIEELKKSDNISFYRIKFNESILGFLKLPHHGHGINLIPPFGKNTNDSLNLFYKREKENSQSECILKIRNLQGLFYSNNLTEWDNSFILIGNNKDIAHPGDHYSKSESEEYYIFNGFHRIMAYLLQLKETGVFKPLIIYYAELKNEKK